MIVALTITHAVVSLALIIIVLLQQGKQQGLSGAIAGGAETFFGKSKARTIDSMLKKFTTVVAALFIINSIALYFVIAADQPPPAIDWTPDDFMQDQNAMQPVPTGWLVDADGNIVDQDGEIVAGHYLDEDSAMVVDSEGNPLGNLFVMDNQIMELAMPDFDMSGALFDPDYVVGEENGDNDNGDLTE